MTIYQPFLILTELKEAIMLFSLHNTHTQIHHARININCTYFPDIISLKVSDVEDDSVLDQQDAALTTDVETPNTFGRNLLRRLGVAQGSEAEATGTSSNNIILLINKH